MSKTTGNGRREFLKGSAAAVLAANCWDWQIRLAAAAEDHASVHGMAIVGEQTVFLSHLPLFGPPHDYQVILEATFAKPGSDPQADYFSDRKRSRERTYTLEPDSFVLPRLAGAQPLRSFKGNVYRGRYEELARKSQRALDAGRIARDVDVNVTRVVHFRKFDPNAAKSSQLEYLLFGKGDELFLAHLITEPPDFDQILSVKAPNNKFTDAELSRGISVVFPDKTNSVSRRISGAAPVTGQIKAAGGAVPQAVQLQPGVELYFEKGELED
jgi:hypothetical protein